MPNIKEIAEQCGVSTATVSRILNNKESAIKPETRAHVLQVVRKLNYRPNATARGLRARRMYAVGLIAKSGPPQSLEVDPFFGPILDGVLRTCRQADHKTIVYMEDAWDAVDNRIDMYLDGSCDGFLLVLPREADGLAAELQRQGTPFVCIGQGNSGWNSSVVAVDNIGVGEMATRHLLQYGHRRIAYLSGSTDLASSRLRLQGYRKALREASVTEDEALIVSGEYRVSAGYDNTRTLMERIGDPRRPTALFCADDWIALGALRALADLGIRVPEQMSVIGVNDGMEAATANPPLTTVRQPLRLIAQYATDELLGQLKKVRLPEAVRQEEILLPGELISRATVGPPAIWVA
jgi:LacI family transcriptional regulator